MPVKRGDIWLCDLAHGSGSEQMGTRPVIVLQNDKGNDVSPITTIVPLTSQQKHAIPTHVALPANETGVSVDSIAMVEQIRCVDKRRLLRKLGSVTSTKAMQAISNAIRTNLAL